MTISLAQQATGTSAASSTSVAATLSSGATAGNILWCAVGIDKTAGTITPPSGFTAVLSNASTSLSMYFGYKVAAGGETTFTLTHTTAAPNGSTMWVGEFSDTAGGTWAVLSSATNPTNEATVTALSSGTAAAPPMTCAAIAAFTIDSSDSSTNAEAWSNSFTAIRALQGSGGASRADVAVGWLSSTAGGSTKETTHTHGPTADQKSGAIATFAKRQTADVTIGSTFGSSVTAVVGNVVSRQFTFSVTAAASVNASAAASVSSSFALTAGVAVQAVAASTPITVRLEIEFTPGVWEDMTPYLCYRSGPIRIRQGRATRFDDITPALLSFDLWNDDGRFMPENTASPHYPHVTKGTWVALVVIKGGVEFTRFVGPISAIQPEFPGESTNTAIVGIVATDALGVLAQRKLRSNITEISLWRGRTDAVACDAYEASGDTSGLAAYLTNYSTDAAAGAPEVAFLATDGALSFGTDNDVSIGGVVIANSQQTSKTIAVIQANHLQIRLHFKGPGSQTPVAASYYPICTFVGVSGVICQLSVKQNGTANGLNLMNAANTTALGFIGDVPFGGWCVLVALSRVANPATSDWLMVYPDGSAVVASNMAVDVRTIRSLWIPGNQTPSIPNGSWGGIAALGTRTTINAQDSFVAASNGTLVGRVGQMAAACDELPISIVGIGTPLTGAVATGVWSGRPASEVLQEMMRTHSGAVWACPNDGVVYVIGQDLLYPKEVTATIETDADCIGAPRLVDGTESRPTRIDVLWPGGVATAIDRAAELADGVIRTKRITTVAATPAVALAAGQAVLSRSTGGLQISQIDVDLMGAAHDLMPVIMSEATTLGALHPTARFRVEVPFSHFNVPTKDVHVEGWTESYGPDQARLRMDTSPAVPATYFSDTWTAANGTAWSGSYAAAGGGGTAGSTVDVQSNRGRILSGAGGDVWKRVTTFTAADIEVTGLVQVQGTAEAQVLWRADSTLANGYALVFSVSGGVRVQRIIAGSISNLIPAFGPSISASTDYRFRLRSHGKYLSIRAWAAAGSEPGTWSLNTTNDLFLAAGYVALRQWTASQTCLFDDLTITTGA